MPKKARSAAVTSRARRKTVLAFVAKLFRNTAAAMEKAEGAEARFAVLAERLAGQEPRLKSLDRKTDARLLQAIADAARDVASGLARLNDAGRAPSDNGITRLADGLDRLSDGILRMAQSLPLQPSKPKSKKSQVNAKIERLHGKAVELAEDYHVKAMALREAAGLEPPEYRLIFRIPEPAHGGGEEGCSCGASRVILPGPFAVPPLPKNAMSLVSSGAKADLPLLIRGLDGTGISTATHLRSMAAVVIVLVAAAIACADSCDPPEVVRVSFIMASHREGTPGTFFPMLGFRWIICCACPCCLVFTEQKRESIESWGQVTVLDPKPTRSAANDAAMRRGRQVASDYNDALSADKPYQTPTDITPAVEPPACFCS